MFVATLAHCLGGWPFPRDNVSDGGVVHLGVFSPPGGCVMAAVEHCFPHDRRVFHSLCASGCSPSGKCPLHLFSRVVASC